MLLHDHRMCMMMAEAPRPRQHEDVSNILANLPGERYHLSETFKTSSQWFTQCVILWE